MHAHPGQPRVYMPRIPVLTGTRESQDVVALPLWCWELQASFTPWIVRSASSKPQRASIDLEWSLGADRGYNRRQAAHRRGTAA